MEQLERDRVDRIERVLPYVVFTGVVILLQVHSIDFWSQYVSESMGWAWSVALEVVALSLLYSANGRLIKAGWLAAMVLLAGPMYVVTSPLILDLATEKRTVEARPEVLEEIRAQIRSLEESLKTKRGNSKKREGWLKAIEKTEQELSATRKELIDALAPPVDALPWQRKWVIAMQVIALLLFQLVSAVSVRTIYRQRHPMEPLQFPPAPPMEPLLMARPVVPSPMEPLQLPSHREDGTTSDAETAGSISHGTTPRSPGPDDGTTSDSETTGSISHGTTPCSPGRDGGTTSDSETTGSISHGTTPDLADLSRSELPIELVEEIAAALHTTLTSQRPKMSLRTFAKQHKFAHRDLSLIKNHRRRIDNGERTATDSDIRRLGKLLGVLPEETPETKSSEQPIVRLVRG